MKKQTNKKITKKLMSHTDKLNKIISDAKNKTFSALNAAGQFCHILMEFGQGQNIKNNIFNDTLLDFNVVEDKINCHHCKGEIKITASNVPKILRIHENISNGIGSSFRPLRKLGVKYNKTGSTITFDDIGDPQVYVPVPTKINHMFDKMVADGDAKCIECSILLYGESFKNKNWHTDHKYSDTPEKYVKKSFRDDSNNYQLLCISCNNKKREIERMRREEI